MLDKIKFTTILKGSAMGIAEVIPGVSGGTIAFISGIYEQLLNSIKSFDIEFLRLLQKFKFKEIWIKINGWFLFSLLFGMVIGIGCGIIGVSYLMIHYPEPLWGFFFGLVIASAFLISKQISHWNLSKYSFLILGTTIALFISLVSPSEGSTHPAYIFISGMIAISAFILPGISGSFMLLLMGMYTLIISSLKNLVVSQDFESFKIILIFGLGCLVGIIWFSRILSWLFEHYRNNALVLLTGFLIGSLYKIWPWRNINIVVDKISGEKSIIKSLSEFSQFEIEKLKILKEVNVLPSQYWMGDPKTILTLIAIILGFIIVFLLDKFSSPNQSI